MHDINSEIRSHTQGILDKLNQANSVGTGSTAIDSPEVGSLREFQSKWNLDERCMDRLRTLPPDVLRIVMAQFNPRPGLWGSNNHSGRCMSFANSILRTSWAQTQAMPSQPAVSLPASSSLLGATTPAEASSCEIGSFAAYWNMDPVATERLLYDFPAEVQACVIREFQLKGEVRNPIQMLRAFVRSVATNYTNRYPGTKCSYGEWRQAQSSILEPGIQSVAPSSLGEHPAKVPRMASGALANAVNAILASRSGTLGTDSDGGSLAAWGVAPATGDPLDPGTWGMNNIGEWTTPAPTDGLGAWDTSYALGSLAAGSTLAATDDLMAWGATATADAMGTGSATVSTDVIASAPTTGAMSDVQRGSTPSPAQGWDNSVAASTSTAVDALATPDSTGTSAAPAS